MQQRKANCETYLLLPRASTCFQGTIPLKATVNNWNPPKGTILQGFLLVTSKSFWRSGNSGKKESSGSPGFIGELLVAVFLISTCRCVRLCDQRWHTVESFSIFSVSPPRRFEQVLYLFKDIDIRASISLISKDFFASLDYSGPAVAVLSKTFLLSLFSFVSAASRNRKHFQQMNSSLFRSQFTVGPVVLAVFLFVVARSLK